MSKQLLSSLAAGTAFLLLATAAQAQVASPPAENSETSSPPIGADIIVTAQRRSERLQSVPIAITAVGAAELATRGISDVSSLSGVVPGLAISSFGGINSSNLVAIRGIAGQPLPIGAGQATAIYLDGVYLSRPDAGFFTLDDVERVEVLRGPQGALYGRNATAGAINIITREPGDTVRGGIDASYGNFNSVVAKGSLSGPLGSGFSAGISGSFDRRDGYFTNTLTGKKADRRRGYTARAKLRYVEPGGQFDATLSGDISAVDGADVIKNPYAFPTAVYNGLGDADEVSVDSAGSADLRIRSRGASLVMNYALAENLTLTSITGLRRLHVITAYDGDGSPIPAAFSYSDNYARTFNQEVRGVYTGTAFRMTLGANYFSETANFGISNSVIPTANNPYDTSDLKAWAVFGQAEYDITNRVTLVGGLRYNHEHRDFVIDYSQAPVPGARTPGTVKDNALIPSFGVNFKLTPDVLLYAKASQGYQAPGFNMAPGVGQPVNTFDAEKLWAYEFGIKSQFLNRRVTLNVAGFYYDYKDIQIRSVTGLGITTIDNAASATNKGVEASLAVLVVPGLTFGAQGTYLDAKYDKYCQVISAGAPQYNDPSCGAGRAERGGNRLNQAPKWSGGVNVAYEGSISDAGILRANVNYSWESNSYFSTVNEPEVSTGGWDRIDGRVGFELTNGPEIYVFGKNLGNNRYFGFTGRAATNLILASVNAPRTYGVGARFKF